jgi:Skp family chaperone for outer membrane proteins
MNGKNQPISVSMITIVAVLGALAAFQTLAQRGGAADPPIVAAVRIEPLFDGLQQRALAKTEIAALEADITAEGKRRQAIIVEMEQSLEDVVAANKREELSDEIALERLKLQFWSQQATAEFEVEKAIRLQHLYTSVKKAIEDMALAEGYDIVVLNDASMELPFERDARVPAQLQILEQIASRKLLYLKPALDVTDDLIMRMNNEFRAAETGP